MRLSIYSPVPPVMMGSLPLAVISWMQPAACLTKSAALYRYEISTGESQRLMTGVASYRMNQDGTLLVDRMNQPILLLDPEKREEV